MSNETKHAIGRLYDREPGVKLNNVKFFRGDAKLIRPDAFKEEQRKIDAQKASGQVKCNSTGPRASKKNVDFRALVASL